MTKAKQDKQVERHVRITLPESVWEAARMEAARMQVGIGHVLGASVQMDAPGWPVNRAA